MKIRKQARGIVVNAKGEFLFVKHEDDKNFNVPGQRWGKFWIPPGGGLDEGETFEQAALREVFEETEILVDSIIKLAHSFKKEMIHHGEIMLIQAEYYLMRINNNGENINFSNTNEGILDARWWSYKEMLHSKESFRPTEISGICKQSLIELGFLVNL